MSRSPHLIAAGWLAAALAGCYSPPIPDQPRQFVTAAEFYERGEALLEEGKLEAADADFTEAIERDPTMALAYISRSATRERLGRPESARADLDRAIDAQPNSPSCYVSRGLFREQHQDLAGAVADYDKVIALVGRPGPQHPYRPHLITSLYNRARIRRHLGDRVGTTADLAQVLVLDPLHRDAVFLRGMVLMDQGQYDLAAEDFGRVIDVDPRNALAFANRGLVRVLQGKEADAVEDFAEFLTMRPDEKAALDSQIQAARKKRDDKKP